MLVMWDNWMEKPTMTTNRIGVCNDSYDLDRKFDYVGHKRRRTKRRRRKMTTMGSMLHVSARIEVE